VGARGYTRRRRGARWLRFGLWLLAIQAALVGLWALFGPRSFYEDFPWAGFGWVSALPPYNEHLVRDFGGLYTGFAVLFTWAAADPDARLVRPLLIAWLPFAVAHLIFHFNHLERLSTVEQAGQLAALGLALLLPLGLLVALRRAR
jgi:hypothetical protein